MQPFRPIRMFVAALLLCAAPYAMAIEYSGIWWDPGKSGQGVNIHQEGNNIFGVWYLYDADGMSMWLTFEGVLNGTSLTADLREFSGPPLGSPTWDANLVQPAKVGTVTVTFNSGASAVFAYNLGSTSGTLSLVRFGNKTLHLDGFYQGTAVASKPVVQGGVCGSALMAFAIIDHELSGFALDTDGEFYTLSATVSSAGAITAGVFAENGFQNTSTFSGSVNGSSASGSWSHIQGCSGTWSAPAQ